MCCFLQPLEKAEDDVGPTTSKKKDIFTFEVPLNDTGSAGLGISVKGKTSNTPNGPVDMGIFIKNIFHGGAAHKVIFVIIVLIMLTYCSFFFLYFIYLINLLINFINANGIYY